MAALIECLTIQLSSKPKLRIFTIFTTRSRKTPKVENRQQ